MEQPRTRGECCMCGDYGLSEELFQCKVCQFRSQHRYCSNLYPKADSYRVCNWCLSREQEKVATPISSDSSLLSSKKRSGEGDGVKKTNDDGKLGGRSAKNLDGTLSVKSRGSTRPSPERAARKRIITRRELEEKLRRTKAAEDMSKQQQLGYRNKVRRYKLLDEVSSC
ncbi:uncharacterized protein LOC116196315 [Punica granatum]|uniref:Uncharacterized protein LOC116196315 n=2 Tax=Punica granatum TaxID=22663 RepID=A0A6P8CD55_PUNGR|nr:uncharacterized protein LOC116196315 [Punica granatum]PKI45603.1 hypothetical protein CRG98_033919 [Punica granatum]